MSEWKVIEAVKSGDRRTLENLLAARANVRDMRRFRGRSESRVDWQEPPAHGANGAGEAPLAEGDIVYLHQDLTVTGSMWHEESVAFKRITPEWQEFCERELEFTIPEDLR